MTMLAVVVLYGFRGIDSVASFFCVGSSSFPFLPAVHKSSFTFERFTNSTRRDNSRTWAQKSESASQMWESQAIFFATKKKQHISNETHTVVVAEERHINTGNVTINTNIKRDVRGFVIKNNNREVYTHQNEAGKRGML